MIKDSKHVEEKSKMGKEYREGSRWLETSYYGTI